MSPALQCRPYNATFRSIYLTKSYYEIWLAGLETMLAERGLRVCVPFDAIPYILVFDANVGTIELRLWGKQFLYERAGTEELDSGSSLTVIEGGDAATRFIVHEEDGIQAAVPVLEREDGSYELLLPDDVPRLFKFLPLVNSVNIGLPVVFHSPEFLTTEDRDGLMFSDGGAMSDANKGLLTKAAACFLQLARNCGKGGASASWLTSNLASPAVIASSTFSKCIRINACQSKNPRGSAGAHRDCDRTGGGGRSDRVGRFSGASHRRRYTKPCGPLAGHCRAEQRGARRKYTQAGRQSIRA